MESAEGGITIAPQDAQCRRDSAPTRRQDDAGDQDEDVRPRRTGKQIGEAREPGHEALRQRSAGRAGEKPEVLHPIGRIGVLNRGKSYPCATNRIGYLIHPRLSAAPRPHYSA